MEKYKLTEEHRAQLKPWADKWVKNSLSTEAMTEEEREISRNAVAGMYAAANYTAPPVFFVASPVAAAFAVGAACELLEQQPKLFSKRASPENKAKAVTELEKVISGVKTVNAVPAQAGDAWYMFNKPNLSPEAIRSASLSWKIRQGGNHWSAYAAFLSFFRHVAKLGETHGVDYSKWDHWEKLAMHSGPRYVHENFCIISDRPCVLKVDQQNRPHCEDGPFCEWRDGTALFSWHGTRVPAKWILDRSTITTENALNWPNTEERRAAVEMVGWKTILQNMEHVIIDTDAPHIGQLFQVNLPSDPGAKFLRVMCGTAREFVLPVPPEMKTALQANTCMWSGLTESDVKNAEGRS